MFATEGRAESLFSSEQQIRLIDSQLSTQDPFQESGYDHIIR